MDHRAAVVFQQTRASSAIAGTESRLWTAERTSERDSGAPWMGATARPVRMTEGSDGRARSERGKPKAGNQRLGWLQQAMMPSDNRTTLRLHSASPHAVTL